MLQPDRSEFTSGSSDKLPLYSNGLRYTRKYDKLSSLSAQNSPTAISKNIQLTLQPEKGSGLHLPGSGADVKKICKIYGLQGLKELPPAAYQPNEEQLNDYIRQLDEIQN